MKELEDYSWFPKAFRNFQTEFIGFVVSKFNVYEPFINYIKSKKHKSTIMFDLCSGSGEPAQSIYLKSNVFNEVMLSDKFPSSNTILKLDVLNMNFEANKCYTMFNAIHHFTKEEKKQIVQKIKQVGAEAYFVEILEPTILFALKVLSATTIGNLILSPFVKPFSLKRLFFTYIIPINILTISYDGIISVLKSGSMEYYKELFKEDVNVFRLKKNLFTLVVIEIKSDV